MTETIICVTPDETYELGKRIGGGLQASDAVLLRGGLGAGKTLLAKGILDALGFDVDEVTSPSFTLVNIYPTERLDVYHIDLWRVDKDGDPAFGVGLDEIVEQPRSAVIIEWAERLDDYAFPARVFEVMIEGSGDQPRTITIESKTRTFGETV